MIRLEMKNCNMIVADRLQKYLHYHLEKNDKYEYIIGEEILPSDQRGVIEQAKFSYSPLGNALEKQRKTIENQGESKSMKNNWLILMNLLKMIFISTEMVYGFKNKNKYLIKF